MKLIKEPQPYAITLASVAVGWVIAAAVHGLYISDVVVHAVAVGANIPDWVSAFAAIPAWIWLLPAAVDLAAAAFSRSIAQPVLRSLAITSFAALIVYACLAVAALFFVSFAGTS
jgi:hypothetical protein